MNGEGLKALHGHPRRSKKKEVRLEPQLFGSVRLAVAGYATTRPPEPHKTCGAPSGAPVGYTIGDMAEKRKHEDTSVSLDLTFEEAIARLVHAPKREGSQAEESGSTKAADPASAPSKKRTAPRRKPSAG